MSKHDSDLINNIHKVIKPIERYSEFAKNLDKTKPIVANHFEYSPTIDFRKIKLKQEDVKKFNKDNPYFEYNTETIPNKLNDSFKLKKQRSNFLNRERLDKIKSFAKNTAILDFNINYSLVQKKNPSYSFKNNSKSNDEEKIVNKKNVWGIVGLSDEDIMLQAKKEMKSTVTSLHNRKIILTKSKDKKHKISKRTKKLQTLEEEKDTISNKSSKSNKTSKTTKTNKLTKNLVQLKRPSLYQNYVNYFNKGNFLKPQRFSLNILKNKTSFGASKETKEEFTTREDTKILNANHNKLDSLFGGVSQSNKIKLNKKLLKKDYSCNNFLNNIEFENNIKDNNKEEISIINDKINLIKRRSKMLNNTQQSKLSVSSSNYNNRTPGFNELKKNYKSRNVTNVINGKLNKSTQNSVKSSLRASKTKMIVNLKKLKSNMNIVFGTRKVLKRQYIEKMELPSIGSYNPKFDLVHCNPPTCIFFYLVVNYALLNKKEQYKNKDIFSKVFESNFKKLNKFNSNEVKNSLYNIFISNLNKKNII